MKFLFNFFKRIFTSRTAYLFFFAHWILFGVAVYQRGGLKTYFHASFEPILVQVLTLFDLVGYIFGSVASIPILLLLSIPINSSELPWFMYVIWFLSISLQWLLIGYGIEKLIKHRRNAIKK